MSALHIWLWQTFSTIKQFVSNLDWYHVKGFRVRLVRVVTLPTITSVLFLSFLQWNRLAKTYSHMLHCKSPVGSDRENINSLSSLYLYGAGSYIHVMQIAQWRKVTGKLLQLCHSKIMDKESVVCMTDCSSHLTSTLLQRYFLYRWKSIVFPSQIAFESLNSNKSNCLKYGTHLPIGSWMLSSTPYFLKHVVITRQQAVSTFS